ncbi:MAG: ribosome-associated protein [Paraglaciecola sp.]|uniref:ribosome biogenesis factor YjgA n=1 Tax=Pseudomonadati TaxID=3379134 RepID=UPI00273D4AC7|nr:ribosome biogenesis factor YjgA [Paraglaciecola sp.]MDP5031065.1 ribosome-associated protein [Paraglaciecola sp.]MDP5131606.1 ribosome-associated protein [Paraglaciecola sp.]
MAAPKKHKDVESDFQIDDETEILSKTQLKQQMLDQQKLGVSLIELSPTELAKIPMDEALLDAVMLARRITGKKEGFRRQLQLIGKMMRQRDNVAIEQAVQVIKSAHQTSSAAFHKIEVLRDNIINIGDEKIAEAVEKYPLLDRQKLRQLSRQANKEKASNKPPKAARELFKYLQQAING